MTEGKKVWKVKNVKDFDIKVSVAKSSSASQGVILRPSQFCISMHNTKMIDAQRKRKMVVIDEEYIDDLGLEIGVAYDEIPNMEEAKKIVDKYTES
jgi:hypothetical protein